MKHAVDQIQHSRAVSVGKTKAASLRGVRQNAGHVRQAFSMMFQAGDVELVQKVSKKLFFVLDPWFLKPKMQECIKMESAQTGAENADQDHFQPCQAQPAASLARCVSEPCFEAAFVDACCPSQRPQTEAAICRLLAKDGRRSTGAVNVHAVQTAHSSGKIPNSS